MSTEKPPNAREPSLQSLAGLRVAAFESRRSVEMASLIERHGGRAFVSPAMRETPLVHNQAIAEFAHRVLIADFDAMIILTGVGFRHLLAEVERKVDRQRFLDALSDLTTIVRGPKPAAALREVGITPSWIAPPPSTWREVLKTIDEHAAVVNQRVVVQEYGVTNPSLTAGLEARGAEVAPLRIYEWELPEDTTPLEENLRQIVAGNRDVALFTAAQQVVNLLEIAERLKITPQLFQAMKGMAIGSVGPTTSEVLRDKGFSVDFEPEHAKMGHLVAAAALEGGQILAQKKRIHASLSGPESASSDAQAPWFDSPFMKACRREPCEVTPVWMMRQAGRYMAEYREVRAKTTFLELCKNPALCSEVMVTAVRRLGVDAAIIFSDLLPILEPMGFDLEFAQGEGPVIHNPLREAGEVDRVLELENVDALDFVMETVRQTRRDLPADMPLIGFAGAPFTLASYIIEGGASRNYARTKTLMFQDPGAWRSLMQRFSRAIVLYLNAQIAAGAQCVQLFDSWAGCLSTHDYRECVLPHVQYIAEHLTPGVPLINFATGNPALLPLLAEAQTAVVGIDWRIGLDEAWRVVGHDRAVQGNLDPTVFLTSPEEIRRRVQQVLDQAEGRPGHIFNLGHGILQQTPVENAIALVDAVHELSAK